MNIVALWTGYATMLLGLIMLILEAGSMAINRIFRNVELKREFLAFYVARLKAKQAPVRNSHDRPPDIRCSDL